MNEEKQEASQVEQEAVEPVDEVAVETDANDGSPVGEAPAAGAVAEVDGLEALEAELSDAKDRYLRLAAEFDNYKKRLAREQLASRARAQGELITGMLDALDDLGRVAHPDQDREGVKDVLEGVQLVERKLLRHLETAGLERLGDPDVPFDPNVHEAVATAPAASEDEDQTVAAVFQIGYSFHGQLLRPARVQVRVWSGEGGG